MIELFEIVIGAVAALTAIWILGESVARANNRTLFLPKSTRRVKGAMEDAEVARHREVAARHESATDVIHAKRDRLVDAIKEGDVTSEEQLMKELMPPKSPNY